MGKFLFNMLVKLVMNAIPSYVKVLCKAVVSS